MYSVYKNMRGYFFAWCEAVFACRAATPKAADRPRYCDNSDAQQ